MAFDAPAVNKLFAEVLSHAQQLGIFDRVNQHEPKSAPGRGISLSVWVDHIGPQARLAGLASVAGSVTLMARAYRSFLSEPGQNDDEVDPKLLGAVCTLLAEYSTHFTLDGDVMAVDLLGISGERLDARAGYIEQDGKKYRVMEITLPVLIETLWGEAP